MSNIVCSFYEVFWSCLHRMINCAISHFFYQLKSMIKKIVIELYFNNSKKCLKHICLWNYSIYYTDSSRRSMYIVFTPAFFESWLFLCSFCLFSFFLSAFVCSHFFGPVIEKINQSTFHQSRNSNFLNIRARKILKTVLEISQFT